MIIKDISSTIKMATKEVLSVFKLAVKEVLGFLKYNYKNYESGETYRDINTGDDLMRSQY